MERKTNKIKSKQANILVRETPTKEELHTTLPFISDLNNIIYEYLGNPFIIVINSSEIIIPNIISDNGLIINWGDGLIDRWNRKKINERNIKHNYKRSGAYSVSIYGDITNIFFTIFGLEISQWGNIRLYNGHEIFKHCLNLNITARDQPHLKYVTDLSGMFADCGKLNADLSRWDVSNVQNMSFMFNGCIAFNEDLSKWNVSNVQNMKSMFDRCRTFNADLSKWNVSNVQNMEYMFHDCHVFNADLCKWNVSNVQNKNSMFYGCDMFKHKFKCRFSDWDVSNVTHMGRMLKGCGQFNGVLSDLNTGKCIDMESMFSRCR